MQLFSKLLNQNTARDISNVSVRRVAIGLNPGLVYDQGYDLARAALEKARDQLEEPVVAALEAEIAKTEGADPIAESVRSV